MFITRITTNFRYSLSSVNPGNGEIENIRWGRLQRMHIKIMVSSFSWRNVFSPNTPELNLTEPLWDSIIEINVKRDKRHDVESLNTRTTDAGDAALVRHPVH